jgi:broad specificity phosphatase PhoE
VSDACLPFSAVTAEPGQRTVLVSRHGRSTGNAARLHQHWGDFPLTADGREQAQRATRWWQDRAVRWVVSSPVVRAMQTAEVIFGRIDEIDAGWTEHAAPTLAGRTYAQVHADHPQLLREDGWPVREAAVSPLLEAWPVVCDRATAALRRAAARVGPGQAAAVVTHGSLLTALASLGGHDSATLPNLAVLQTRVDPVGGWLVEGVHDPLG